jgi:hypothetical protein
LTPKSIGSHTGQGPFLNDKWRHLKLNGHFQLTEDRNQCSKHREI